MSDRRTESPAWLFWLVLAVLAIWILGILSMALSERELKQRRLALAQEKLTRASEDSFGVYIRQAWPVVEHRRDFVPNWHIDAMADHLQAVAQGIEQPGAPGTIRRLIINIPPGQMKSLSTAVFWPTWLWGPRNLPHLKILSTAHSLKGVAQRDALKSRRLIQSNWYRGRWGRRFGLAADQTAKQKYETDKGGSREIGSPFTQMTGARADLVIVDDPIDVMDVIRGSIDDALDGVIDWWDGVMQDRMNDPKTSPVVIIMHRVHERDLCGHVAKRDGYDVLALPNEYDPARRTVTSIGFEDPRTTEGELLNPARLGPAETEAAKIRHLDRYEGLYQQQPVASSGRLIQRASIKHWQALPSRFDLEIISVDATFKGDERNDYVVARRWGLIGADKYLCPEGFREHLDFPNTIEALIALRLQCPNVGIVLIEDKANGPAIIASLHSKVPGIEAFDPGERDKPARVRAAAPDFKAGNIYVPPVQDTDGRPIPEYAWVLDTIDEWVRFPKAAHDDETDSMTQALIYLNSSANAWANFMKQQYGQTVEAEKLAAAARAAATAGGHIQTVAIAHTGSGDSPVASTPAPEPSPHDDLSAWASTWGKA